MSKASTIHTFLAGGGEMGVRTRAFDWARTPVGPPERWPTSLSAIVSALLSSRHPMFLWWGPDLVQFYNDGYRPSLGADRHPDALGARGREFWAEIWPAIGPQIEAVMTRGESTWNEDHLVPIFRNGRLEEVYWTYGYSPVRDDDGTIGGTLVVVQEQTRRILGERRLRTLRDLAASASTSRTEEHAWTRAAEALAGNPRDLPWALLYAVSDDGSSARLAGRTGAGEGGGEDAQLTFDGSLDEPWPLRRVLEAHEPLRVDDVRRRVGDICGPASPEPAQSAWLVPIRRPNAPVPYGVLVAGISPHLGFDPEYQDFLTLAADYVATAISNARTIDEERQRAESLAEAQLLKLKIRSVEELHARRLASIFKHAPVGIAVLRGPEHVYELANPPYLELAANRDVLGKPIRKALPELSDQGIYELLDRVYTSGEPFVGRSVGLILNRGDQGTREEAFFDFVYQPTFDDQGRIDGIAVVVFEVTELTKARREAEAANRAKDEFLAMLGHELRNPLAPIMTALQLMRLRNVEVAQKERAIIERQVKHLLALVDDLLDVSRITRGKIKLKTQAVEIAEVVAKAIEMSSPLLEQQQHHLRIEVAPRGLLVDADPGRLAQALANLLSNAAKYTPSGGEITIRGELQGGSVVVKVVDTGIGIEPEMLTRVFDLFMQEGQALDRAKGGLGLGLAIVRSLVVLHGGEVSAASGGRGRGSEFTIRLPALDPSRSAAPARAGPDAPAAPQTPSGCRILVVDDNEDAADMVAASLAAMGHEIRTAYDGPSALALAPAFQPHVALLDIGLPVMDGYELAERLRSDPRLAGIRLIALTGYGMETDRQRSKNAGFEAHMVKPVDLELLNSVLLQESAVASGGRES
jgi:signal transduction histidine kinase/ActR/RegA family two-component response regulator